MPRSVQAEVPAGGEDAGTTRTRRRLPSVATAYLLVGGAVAVAAACGLFAPSEYALSGIGIATLVALVTSVAVRRPSHIWPWAAVALALALFMAGGLARAILHTMGNLTASRSLLPDLLALPGYALLAAGLLGFSRRAARGPQRQSSVVLDGLIAALALAAVAWVFVIQPVLLEHDVPLPVTLVLVAYPSMSIFMVVVTLRIAFSPAQERVPAFWFLLVGDDAACSSATSSTCSPTSASSTCPHRLLDLPYALALPVRRRCALHAVDAQAHRARPAAAPDRLPLPHRRSWPSRWSSRRS